MISDNNDGLPRYCHPFHGGWDVARIALNIPESKILFVCPVSCARIIKLNALDYGYGDRIYVLGLTEEDIVAGDYERKTVEAATEILLSEKKRPKAFIIYVSCIDAMLGNDHDFQTREIMSKFHDVNCFVLKMCPITRYSSDLPLVQLQHDMYAALPKEKVAKKRTVAFIGSNIPLSEEDEIIRLLKKNRIKPLHIGGSISYDDYLDIRSSMLNICFMPFGSKACEMLKERYDTDFMPILMRHNPDYIDSVITELCARLNIGEIPDMAGLRENTFKRLEEAARICKKELIIDSTASLFTGELMTILKEAGFVIGSVYCDGTDGKNNETDMGDIFMPGRRKFGKKDGNRLALGQPAGCFANTEDCLPLFYDNGHWGYRELEYIADCITGVSDERSL